MRVLDLPADAKQALEEGSIMRAVKLVKEHHGTSLTEAKYAVDSYLDHNPMLARRVRKPPPPGCVLALGVIVIGILTLIVLAARALV